MTILEVKELHQSYSAAAPVLRGISFRLERGEFAGVIGLSGAGKSTLLRCINRLINASSGEILVSRALVNGDSNGASIDVLKLNPADLRALRRKVGMIFNSSISSDGCLSLTTCSRAGWVISPL